MKKIGYLLIYTAVIGSTMFTACREDDDVPDINVTFPDANFRAYVMENFDTDHDGIVSTDEANAVKDIICDGKNIASLTGIEVFPALTMLSCNNNQLTTLDVNKNTALTYLSCNRNQLTTLDVSKNTALTNLLCSINQLTTLDVSNNTELTQLRCNNNQLTTLDVSNNTELTQLRCSNNQLTALDVRNNTELITLDSSGNQLTALDVSKNAALRDLGCTRNQLTALDVSKNTALVAVECSNNLLNASALDDFFNSLPTVAGNGLLFITGNPGANTCDKSIATNKGWIYPVIM